MYNRKRRNLFEQQNYTPMYTPQTPQSTPTLNAASMQAAANSGNVSNTNNTNDPGTSMSIERLVNNGRCSFLNGVGLDNNSGLYLRQMGQKMADALNKSNPNAVVDTLNANKNKSSEKSFKAEDIIGFNDDFRYYNNNTNSGTFKIYIIRNGQALDASSYVNQANLVWSCEGQFTFSKDNTANMSAAKDLDPRLKQFFDPNGTIRKEIEKTWSFTPKGSCGTNHQDALIMAQTDNCEVKDLYSFYPKEATAAGIKPGQYFVYRAKRPTPITKQDVVDTLIGILTGKGWSQTPPNPWEEDDYYAYNIVDILGKEIPGTITRNDNVMLYKKKSLSSNMYDTPSSYMGNKATTQYSDKTCKNSLYSLLDLYNSRKSRIAPEFIETYNNQKIIVRACFDQNKYRGKDRKNVEMLFSLPKENPASLRSITNESFNERSLNKIIKEQLIKTYNKKRFI